MKLKVSPHIYALVPAKNAKGYERHSHDDFESALRRIHDADGELIPGASIEWGVVTKDVSAEVDSPPVLVESAVIVYGDKVIQVSGKDGIAAERVKAEAAAKGK